MELFIIFIGAMLVNNFVLSKFLGICSFLGVSKKKDAAFGMGLAVTFVMILSSVMTWLVYNGILVPLGLEYLNTIASVLVIAALVQFVEMAMKKLSPSLHKALGIFLPLITTNCAVLGMTVLNVQEGYNFIESVVNAIGGASGYMLSIVLLAFIREKIDYNENIPKVLRGLPITLFTAALMSIAFLGFQGLIH
ncbi:electron transport complex protein RnfA [Clostridium gasigenes]|uniref:Ion-translocating oxidoreductase complex subunit A n=1 Tax=Clostridium gasigenes TaxID=94869 RepID=A0A1H0RHN2_9CLOT|nr:electron transport complex protein RnfA [Clostridium gasigenes]MBB6623082.1 electron transport complex protein RnfA [Clostridium gasigenes]MBB6715210.1 electron transport complex protein RnfA [Clostridium gasigenes]MBU3087852.1 electron transport complex protein RnfA [Clostridium gasigenes]MBU3104161.1 electron transport complex protein RnfA [Clostridium gasigenes]MBU3107289.1 electron transport complex protein RnfA [Clostridium gasigenes]